MKKEKKKEKIDILRLRCSTHEYNYLLLEMGFTIEVSTIAWCK